MKINIRLFSVILMSSIFLCSCKDINIKKDSKKSSSFSQNEKDNTSLFDSDASCNDDKFDLHDGFSYNDNSDKDSDIDSDSDIDCVIPSSGSNDSVAYNKSNDNVNSDLYTSYYDAYSEQQTSIKKLSSSERMKKYIKDGLIVVETNISGLNLKNKIKIARISDSHLTLANNSDGFETKKQAAERSTIYPKALSNFERAVGYAIASDANITIFTGNIWDFISVANLNKFKSLINPLNGYMFSMGECDAKTYVNVVPSGTEYQNNINLISRYLNYNGFEFMKKEYDDVTLVSMDNSQKSFTQTQVNLLKCEIEKGKQIIIFLHNPIYTKALNDEEISIKKNIDNIIGKSDTLSGSTQDMIKLIESNKKYIKGIFSGNIGYTHHSQTPSGIDQFVINSCSNGNGNIEIINLS